MTSIRILAAVYLFVAIIFVQASHGQITPQLIEAAKKEGEVAFYGALPVTIVKRISDAFEKKYGIAVKHWRGDATEIVNRVLTEARAGRPIFDVDARQRSGDAGARRKGHSRSLRSAGGERLSKTVSRSRHAHDRLACLALRH